MPSLRWIQKNYSFFSFHKIMLFRLVFGFYFECSNSVTVCLLLKLYCIGCCAIGYLQILVNAETYLQLNAAAFYYDFVVVIDTTANVLISLITEEKYVMEFSSKLASDSFSTLQKKQHCLVTYFLLFITYIGELVLLCFSEDLSLTFLTVYFYIIMSYYSSRLTTVYIAENYQKTVQSLCKALKNNFETMNLSACQKYEHVKYFCEDYMELSNNLDAAIKYLRLKVTIAYVGEFLRVLFVAVYVDSFTNFTLSLIVPWILELVLCVLILCVPAFLMELAANDLDDIKIVLADQLLMIQDKKLREAIYDALEYIDACSGKYTIWNGFPFDIKFVFGFFSLSTAYIVTLLQFSY